VKEIEEEVDMIVKRDELFDMTEEIYGPECPGVFPSIGGCDEYLRLFLCYRHVDEHTLNEIGSKSGGCVEGEDVIHVHVVPLCQAHQETPDAQTLCALYFYDKLKHSGAIDHLILRESTKSNG
jgi:ADP-sugar diphosphatase